MKTRYWTWLAWPLGALPLGWIVWQAASGAMGPDPAETFVKAIGWWALVLILTCLSMRPASQLLKVPGLVIWRRTFGLWGFIYACLHFLAWATLLLGWDPSVLGQELTKRPYIVVGTLAWLAMWPLAATSTRKARRRLGRKWTKLHKLIFVTLVLAIIHQYWVQKSGYGETVVFASVAAVLLLYRLLKDRILVKKQP
ncbi:putative sulfite oxidase subunit YedZ [Alcanivorax hongdengensis A-11-3]|uniref:Protein-methionine-sulfoxide reductase heme-binding subunit MsrQ n=1 Tax=Alcanivorax hongdengensis A-11-3 TaxID=1177179 RepID=L0WCP5_9GAMM|nr:protein-methionine-sulfoxide reductase heme-binding subunit MsrQ [Alcanivorax hongdengensis]EKF74513.1 putative sulfite oxidase subunit YedZ [Alcanivorax hongdengensis A-11-3]